MPMGTLFPKQQDVQEGFILPLLLMYMEGVVDVIDLPLVHRFRNSSFSRKNPNPNHGLTVPGGSCIANPWGFLRVKILFYL